MHRRRGLLALGSSAALAAGVSATRLMRQRSARREHRRFELDADRAAGPELRRVVAGQLDLALDELSGRPPDGEAIHETRKALKRSRAALRVGRHLLGRDSYQQENRTLRDAGRALSEARDAEVLEETAEAVVQDAGGPVPEAIKDRLLDAIVPEPASDPQDGPDEARRGISEVRARAEAWPLPREDEPAPLRPGLKRIYRQGRQALGNARHGSDDERWHELRKRSKDLWYAAQLLEGTRPKRMGKLVKRARRLSKLLGEEHDLAVLEERLPDQALPGLGEAEIKLIRRLIRRRRRKLQSQAEGLAGRVYRRKPGRFVRRLGVR